LPVEACAIIDFGVTMRRFILLSLALLTLAGCQNAYFSALEKVGLHKRDILVTRVEDARDSQQAAKEQFKDALERYRSVVQVQGGELEQRYEALNREFEASEASARDVRNRIKAVEDVADALFKEWKSELKAYSNADLRATSAKNLERTQKDYRALLQRMKAAEKRIDPVLDVLRDQVLFLKHNLNARAIGSLQGEYRTLQGNVDQLLADMQRSIDEADVFIRQLQRDN
jgi:septation ring formation regulator EzrA